MTQLTERRTRFAGVVSSIPWSCIFRNWFDAGFTHLFYTFAFNTHIRVFLQPQIEIL